jgi:phage terminase small subunit
VPALLNPKWEKFAQAVVSGKQATEAYREAGYCPDNSNSVHAAASRLLHSVKVRERIDELHGRAAAAVQVSKSWVLEKLIANAERAMTSEPVLDREGEPTGEYTYQGNVANRALELIGKELGMFVERQEHGAAGEFEELSTEQKRERAKAIASELGITTRSLTAGSA